MGTRTYAAPEQLKGEKYGQKADMFSLGLILVELFCPFSTNMEKAVVLHKSKHGQLPPDFLKQYPRESALVLRLLSPDPKQRPGIAELRDLLTRGELCASETCLGIGSLEPALPQMRKAKSVSPPNAPASPPANFDTAETAVKVWVREEEEEIFEARYLRREEG